MFNFPNAPTTGQIFDSGVGPVFVWDGVAWTLTSVQPKNAWQQIGDEYKFSGVTFFDIPNLAPYKRLRWIGSAYITTAAILGYRTSSDNGATFYNGASDYSFQYLLGQATTVAAANGGASFGYMSNTVDAGSWVHFHTEFENFNVAGGDKAMRCHTKQRTAGSMNEVLYGGAINQVAPVLNALRLFPSVAQNFNGSFILEGVRG